MSLEQPLPNTRSRLSRTVRTATRSEAASISASVLNSTELLRGQKTVEINHNGSTYRLQATRLGKLILTK